MAVAAADVAHLRSVDADAVIVRQDADVLPDQYQFAFETSNGISAQESGVLKNAGRVSVKNIKIKKNIYLNPSISQRFCEIEGCS